MENNKIRPIIIDSAYNEAGYNSTIIDLEQILIWLSHLLEVLLLEVVLNLSWRFSFI